MACHELRSNFLEITVRSHAASIAAAAKCDVRFECARLDVTLAFFRDRAVAAARAAIGAPEAATIRSAGVPDKPAIEHYQIIASCRPSERPANLNVVQINQV